MFSFFHLILLLYLTLSLGWKVIFKSPPIKRILEINDSIYDWILVIMNARDYKML
jgi:hypothetical protein